MRIPKTWVPLLAKKILTELIERDVIEPKGALPEVIAEAERVILEELMVEDRLNDEVREVLKKFSGEIEKGRLDYRKVFDMTKKKLVEERGLIL